jgi:hypothetical protein
MERLRNPGHGRTETGAPHDAEPVSDPPWRRPRLRAGYFLWPCPWAWSGLVSMWLQPALVAQNSHARQVSVE